MLQRTMSRPLQGRPITHHFDFAFDTLFVEAITVWSTRIELERHWIYRYRTKV
jgi:hypothetical protein